MTQWWSRRFQSGQMDRGDRSMTTRAPRREGQAMVIFALFLLTLIGFVALAVDVGFLMSERRQAQSAADGAALAADKAYQRKQTGVIVSTGQQYASRNGFADADVQQLATYGPYEYCVRVDVDADVRRFFLGAIYTGPWRVNASGVACTERVTRPYALVALDPNGSGISSGGTSDLEIINGGAMSNSSVGVCGSATWIQASGPLDAYANIDICPNADVEAESYNPASGMLDDPLNSVTQPNCAGMPSYIEKNPANGSIPDIDIKSSDPYNQTLKPGRYPDGLTIKGAHKVTFESGVYCFEKEFNASSGASNPLELNGTNVLFYFPTPSKLDISGEGVTTNWISGPGGSCTTAACNARIVVFYQREAPCNTSEFRLTGNRVNVDGIIYARCSLIHLGGNSGSRVTGQVFGASIDILGGADIRIDYRMYAETKIPMVFLVE